MGATKFENYDSETIHFAQICKVLSEPARVQALLLIANEVDRDVSQTEIIKSIKLSQSTISQHLKILKERGLIESRLVINHNKKTSIVYRINKECFIEMNRHAIYIINQIEKKSELIDESTKTFYNHVSMLKNFSDRIISVT